MIGCLIRETGDQRVTTITNKAGSMDYIEYKKQTLMLVCTPIYHLMLQNIILLINTFPLNCKSNLAILFLFMGISNSPPFGYWFQRY